VGNFEPEFTLLGRSFADRGARADDALRMLRTITGKRVVRYHGTHFDVDDYVVSPHSVQSPMPMWIAGHTARALRRAVELGDGWMPTPASHGGPSDEQIRSMMARHEIPAGFTLLLSLGGALDPLGDPGGTRKELDALEAGPADAANVRFVHTSRQHLVEQMEAFAGIAGLSG
jgi:alkanesulfonate monooxygenase SsuD/methylene tetrahydromethanopterin reductase-like flavin-dependent oxidoreductase (luciferase family)